MRLDTVGRVALQYWLQIGAAWLALAYGFAWVTWALLALYLWALQRIGRWLHDEPGAARGRVLVLCVAGQLPGLLLSLWVGLSFAGLRGEAIDSVVLLQAWTAMWAPLIALLPRTLLQARALYLWVTLGLPLLQLAVVLSPLARWRRRETSPTLSPS